MTADDRYQVHSSQAVSEQFRELATTAQAGGQIRLFTQAARWIMEELARTPLEFGESREDRPDRSLVMRCGFAGPLYVEFAVHQSARVVYIRRFSLRK